MAGPDPILRLQAESVAWREFDTGGVVLDLRSSTYLAANATATVLWRLLARGATRSELAEALVTEFEVQPDRAEGDVDAFLADCRARGLIAEERTA